MRETIQSKNPYGGYDFKYRIKCDVCGEYIMNPTRRGKDSNPREFLTCGEDDLCAISKGWSLLEGGGACCPKCREELAAMYRQIGNGKDSNRVGQDGSGV